MIGVWLLAEQSTERIDGQPVGHFGLQRQVLAEANARHAGRDRRVRPADLCRGVGLGIPGVDLARAAREPEQDDSLLTGRSRLESPRTECVSKSQSRDTGEARLKEPPPASHAEEIAAAR